MCKKSDPREFLLPAIISNIGGIFSLFLSRYKMLLSNRDKKLFVFTCLSCLKKTHWKMNWMGVFKFIAIEIHPSKLIYDCDATILGDK